ncbi:MAG: helix-turn-helix domain-containing protein [Akkermansiaceae bacterium]
MSEWTDIGERLKEAREKKELTLKDVSHQIRIPTSTLKAIEENDYSSFPSPAYAKSFLSQYSEYLAINADDWLDCFETGNVLAHSENRDYLVPDRSEALRATPQARARSSRSVHRKPNVAGQNFTQPLLLFLITAALIGASVWGFLQLEDQIAEKKPKLIEKKPALLPSIPPPPNQPQTQESIVASPNFAPNTGVPTVTGTEDDIAPLVEEAKPPPRAIIVNDDEEE